MNRYCISLLLVMCITMLQAQTKTTKNLETDHDASLNLFFYKNTLRMLNQQNNPMFDEAIKDIKKLKFLVFPNKDISIPKIQKGFRSEKYDPVFEGRMEGNQLSVFIKDSSWDPGTVIMVRDSTKLYILDLIGKIDVNSAGTLFKKMSESSEISGKLLNFMNHESDY